MPRAKTKVQKGFPREFVFECREELDAYLSGDRITCLLCGNSYQLLETHLRTFHDMTGDEYREKYGIPYKRGLCSARMSAARSEISKELFEANRDRQLGFLEQAKAVQEKNGNPQRKKPKFWKSERTKYTRATFDEFIRRVEIGRSAHKVQQDEDMPALSSVHWYAKRDKDFAEKYNNIMDGRPGRPRSHEVL